jgi:hypothetical protein
MTISLRHPHTGDVKTLPEGWSWSCFFGSFLLGTPLFRRGLQVWGAAMVVFNIALMVVEFVPTARAATLNIWMTVIGVGFAVFFGLRANAMAIERYRNLGWLPADPPRRFY